MSTPTPGVPAPVPPAPAPPATDPPPPRQFSQDELNAVAAREKQAGEQRARQALADSLGVPVDQLDARTKELRELGDKDKSDAVKAREEADREKAAAATERAEIATERHRNRIERAALLAGVPAGDADVLADAVALIRVDAAADDAAITAAVEAVKGRHPSMFGAAATPPGAPPAPPTPAFGGQPPANRPPSTGGGADAETQRQLARRNALKPVAS